MRTSVASISKKFISTFFAATLALGLVPAAAFATDNDGVENVISSDSKKSALIEQNEAEGLTDSFGEDETMDGVAGGEDAISIPAATQRVNEDVTLSTRTVAQAESTRSYFLAQTLESTRTVPIVSANLPLDMTLSEPQAPEADAPASDEGEEGEGSDDPDPAVGSDTIAPESIVVGSFEHRGLTYAVEPGGESVVVVAADYAKLPEEFLEAQTIVLPSMVTADGIDYYSVTRIADNAFAGLTFEVASQYVILSGADEADAVEKSAFLIEDRAAVIDSIEDAEDEESSTDDDPIGITAITIPASVVEIGDDAFTNFDTLRYVIASEDNPVYSQYDGCLYDADQTCLLLIPEGRLGAVRIASSVTSVDPEVFSHCPSVDTLVADADSAAYQLLLDMGNIDNLYGNQVRVLTSEEADLRGLSLVEYNYAEVAKQMDSTTVESASELLIEAHHRLAAERVGSLMAQIPATAYKIDGRTTSGNKRFISGASVYASRNYQLLVYDPDDEYRFGLHTHYRDFPNPPSGLSSINSALAVYASHCCRTGDWLTICYPLDAEAGSIDRLNAFKVSGGYASNIGFYLGWDGGSVSSEMERITQIVTPDGIVLDTTDWIGYLVDTRDAWSFDGMTLGSCAILFPSKRVTATYHGEYLDEASRTDSDATVVSGSWTLVKEKGATSTEKGTTEQYYTKSVREETEATDIGIGDKQSPYYYMPIPEDVTPGYFFIGWNTDPKATVKTTDNWFYRVDGIADLKYITRSTDLYAIYENSYSVIWSAAGFGEATALINRDKSYVSDHPDSILVNDAPAANVKEQVKIRNVSALSGVTTFPGVIDPSVEGAAFKGWTSNADGTPPDGGYGQPGDELVVDGDTPKTWYAVWTYPVTFDPNLEGESAATLGDIVSYGAPFASSLPNTVLHSDAHGYRFEGYWDDEGTQWFDSKGAPIQGVKWDYREPVTLTARWTYDVYFDTNTTDPASVLFSTAAPRINEVVALSAGRDIEYTLLNEDEFGNVRYTGKKDGRDRVKVVAWKGSKVELPIAQLRSGYDATQDWGNAANSAYADRIAYDAATGITDGALSDALPATGTDLSRTLYAIWDVDPASANGHAKVFYAKLVDTTSYDQSGEALPVKGVTAATPSVLRAKYDAPLVSMVNLGSGGVKAPVADGLVFDGYYTTLDGDGVASGTQLTRGADKDGNVMSSANLWRIAPAKSADGIWVDEVTGAPLAVESATYGGETVDAVRIYAHWSLPIRDISFDANLDAAADLVEGESTPSVPGTIENVQVNVTPLPASVGALSNLAKYSFDGWWDDPTYGTQYYDETGSLVSPDGGDVVWPDHANTVLYAHWTYGLVLDGNLQGRPNDTVELASGEVASIGDDGSVIAKKTLSTSDGRTFATTVTKGETIALYDAGVQNTPAKVATLATRMRGGEKAGYTFVGYADAREWSTTSTRYTAFDFSRLDVSGTARVYMAWSPNATKLTFVDTWTQDGKTLDPAKIEGGRAGNPGNDQVLYDNLLADVDKKDLPYIPGWDFQGYYLEGSDTPYIAADGVHGDAWETAAEEATLHARYAHRELTVTYDLHGGRDGKPTVSKTFYQQAMPEGPFKPSRKGYDFCGWFACEHATETDHAFGCDDCVMFYDADGKRVQSVWPIDGSAKLHAAWEAATYTIEWAYNYAGSPAALFDRTTQTYASRIALPGRGNPTRPGYGFMGWYTAASGGALVTGTETCILGQGDLTPAGEERTVTYYARWDSGQPFSIVLDAGVGGVFAGGAATYVWSGQGATPADRNIDLNTNVAAVDREDWNVGCRLPGAYEFLGWEEEGEGSKIALKDGVIIPANTDGVHTLVAQWEVKLFDLDFYAYDPDVEAGADAANDDFRRAVIEGGGLAAATGHVKWTYAASPAEGANVSCTEVTAYPVASVPGYEFLGWRLRSGGEPSKDLTADPSAPKSATYVAEFAPIEYTFHFFVSETEQEDEVQTGSYGGSIVLPSIASRTSITATDGFVYNGKWALTAHSGDYPAPSTWVPGATVKVRDVLATPGLTVRASDGSQSDDPLVRTHVYLYARHIHGYSFTVPLRAAIMVAVDDADAPIKVDTGAIEARSAMSGVYRVVSIVSDPVAGEGHTANDNPGTAYTFTDGAGKARTSEVFLTVRNAGAGSDAISIPLDATTVIDDANALADFTFAYGEGNELPLEYGLAFGSGLGPIDFKDHLPVAEGPHYPIARLYYTIGFAS